MFKVAIITLGCKVNQYDSAFLADMFQKAGYHLTVDGKKADLYVINTCTVTNRADDQARQFIRKIYRENPGARIVVTGCYAQVAPREIASLEGVSLVVGNKEKLILPSLLKEGSVDVTGIYVSDLRDEMSFDSPPVSRFFSRTRAFLKIQDGCDSFCTYCVVPYARGKGRSLPVPEVLKRLHSLKEGGYREVVLTGINLSAYGRDLKPEVDLLSLLKEIGTQDILPRIRLSSLEPQVITDEFLTFVKGHKVICPHFHIPFQSGDDRILSLMGRGYDSHSFKGLVERIVGYLPDAAIGLDVMVGFPGEDEKAFFNTVRMIEEMPVSYLHVFPYSPRPMTEAATLKDHVAEGEKRKRVSILRKLGMKKKEGFMRRFLGKELEILLESKLGNGSAWMEGLSPNYLRVLVKNRRLMGNRICKVKASSIEGGKIMGTLLTSEERDGSLGTPGDGNRLSIC